MVAAIFLSSCSSSDDNLLIVDLSVDSLSGIWKMTHAYVSPGGETTWQTVENGTEYTFSPNGNFSASQDECSTGTYNLDLMQARFHSLVQITQKVCAPSM